MKFSTIALAIAAGTSLATATSSCSADNKCPKDFPCCNTDGICGTGESCFGGCDARYSYSPNACVPLPVCQNFTQTFTGTDDMIEYTSYLGDASKYNWTYTGGVNYTDGEVRVTMPFNSTGSVVSSTHYIWYGKVTAQFKSSHLAGVVSDFIIFSNVKDEIDYEFVGTKLEVAQTNFYWQGVANYTNEVDAATTDTYANYHEYTVDWQYDSITWSIDGNSMRTLNKADTYNATSDTYQFPQTPARIQFSIWPGGSSSEPAGTVEWAGGPINWDAPDLTNPGYYYSAFKSVSVECYPPPSGTNTTGSTSYVYTSDSGLEDSVAITDDDTTLANMGDSYLDPSAGASSSEGSSSQTKSIANASQATGSSSPSKTTQTKSIPNASEVSESSSATSTATATAGSDSGSDSGSGRDGSGSGDATATGNSGSGANGSAGSGDSVFGATTSAEASASAAHASSGNALSGYLPGVAASLITGLSVIASIMFFM